MRGWGWASAGLRSPRWPLRPRGHGGLSQLGAYERPARPRRRGGARGHGDSGAAGQVSPAVLAAAAVAGVREVLLHRRRPGHRCARLWHGDRRAGGQDRRAGQRLGGGGEAAGVRRGGIDSIAGPSEVLIVADRDNDPRWIAADLLAQAEHDARAQSILFADDAAFADRVESGGGGCCWSVCRAPPSPGRAGATTVWSLSCLRSRPRRR